MHSGCFLYYFCLSDFFAIQVTIQWYIYVCVDTFTAVVKVFINFDHLLCVFFCFSSVNVNIHSMTALTVGHSL